MVAGITLRLDGMYEQALDQFNRSLSLNPSNAPTIYNHRARVYQYQNQLELAEEELEKGITLEPRHPLLRTSLAYQQMREGNLRQAIEMLEEVIRDDDSMRIAYPTLAMCYVQVGERDRAASLIEEDSMAAAEADSEMAYRLATYFAVDGDESEALHWLRRAIYLGNENYPWFAEPGLEPSPRARRLYPHPRRPEENLPPQPEELEAPVRPGTQGLGTGRLASRGRLSKPRVPIATRPPPRLKSGREPWKSVPVSPELQ
jgi:serine/threonine-protein kinase